MTGRKENRMDRFLNFGDSVSSAKEVSWQELNAINDKADDWMVYLGYHYCRDSAQVFALFRNLDDDKRYCVLLS